MIAARTLMNATAQAARFELRLGRGRAIRAVRVYVRRRVGLVQKSTEFSAVMHARVGHLVVTDQLVLGIRIHVVLVAVEALTVLLGPARILVFLPVFRAVLLPFLWCLAGLHGLVLFAAITLLRDRHDRGINHLAATCNVALRLQMPAKALEQLLNQPSLPQRLTEQPQRRAVGNAILNAKPQKPCERHAVAHLILDLFVGKIVERLQHQHPKHHDDIDRLAARAALLVLRRRPHHGLNLGTEALERHHPIDHLQWIALRRNRRKPLVRIEKSKLSHRPHLCESYPHQSDSHKLEKTAIFRGSLKGYDFIVSFDLFPNEFSDFADIILPNASYLEVLDPRPNYPFIFNHPAGMGDWGWPIRQPVVEPTHARRSARDVMLELAYGLGLGPEINMAVNSYYGLDGPQMLDREKTYTIEEISDLELKHKFGPERGLEWFKEHGVITWPKRVEEVYWRPFIDVRIPIYHEYLIELGEQTGKICRDGDMAFDPAYYGPLPEWLPCHSHEETDASFDLFAFYYRDTIQANGFTMENPWIDEIARMDPFSYRIAINSETARRKGLGRSEEHT